MLSSKRHRPISFTFNKHEMLKIVIKRDGTEEPAQPSKINKWMQWGSVEFRKRVDWSSVVTAAISQCGEKEKSQDVQLKIIAELVRVGDWAHAMVAGRLYAVYLHKKIHGDKIPTVAEKMAQLASLKLASWLDYSPEELETINSMIDHERDHEMAEFQLKYIRGKYAIKNNHTGAEYETAQFVYMRMAMALAETEPKSTRLIHLKNYYDHFSLGRINAPTPNFNNLGTEHRGYASCCLYASGDSIPSLHAGHTIAYMMTANSAGVGGTISTRTLGDPVRNGTIVHQGKLGIYDSTGKLVKENRQGSRGGACTMYYSGFDPEVESITMTQNPRTAESKRIRTLNFAFTGNAFLADKASRKKKKDRLVFLFTEWSAPDLFAKFYSADLKGFIELYEKYEADESFEKTFVDARRLVVMAKTQSYEVGTLFFFNADEANRHTPFKDPIRSSNLCVAPETLILTDRGHVPIISRAGQMTNVWNGEEYSPVLVQQTGQGQKLLHVYTNSGFELECTPYHKWYIFDGYGKPYKEVRTEELRPGDKLCKLETAVIQGYAELDKAYINGFYTGDGCLTQQGQRIYLYNEKIALAEHFPGGGDWFDGGVEMRAYKHYQDLKPKFFVPNPDFTVASRLAWLAGYLDADGCVQRNGDNESIVAASTDRNFLRNVQLMLQTLGVQSKVTLFNNEGLRSMPANNGTGENKDFWCKTTWRLLITSNGLAQLIRLGFAPNRLVVTGAIPQRDASQFVQVEAVVDEGRYDDTFCFTEPKRHLGVFNGLLTGQCTEIMEPTFPYQNVADLFSTEDHGRGEVAMCSLGGIVPSNCKNDTEYRSAAYYSLKMIDKCIELSNYPLPHIGVTAKARMNAGVGLVGVAHYLAERGLKYDTTEGRNEIHRLGEKHAYFLIEASLKISKERGVAKWMHKTKWPEGWLPIDTYKRSVDAYVTVGLEQDWETLRAEIIANGGIGHSCLITHMPTESSSKAVGMPNSLLPIRGLNLLKTDGSNAVDWVAKDSDLLGDNYQIAYTIKKRDMFIAYGLFQKFTDQGISADIYEDRTVNKNIKTSTLIQDYVDMLRFGLKSQYYTNSNVTNAEAPVSFIPETPDEQVEFGTPAEDFERGCASGACSL
jgi:ribonucleoside-diphosphate reductase alpha chain